MAEQFSAEWAKGVIDGGIGRAQELVGNPAKVEELLGQLREKLADVPPSARTRPTRPTSTTRRIWRRWAS